MSSTAERLPTLTATQLEDHYSRAYVRLMALLPEEKTFSAAAKRYEFEHPRSIGLDLITRASVYPGTIADASWAGPLAAIKPLSDAFLAYVRPQTILGRLENVTRVPFNISVNAMSTGGTYGWVGEGAPKRVTFPRLATVTLGTSKCAGIIVLTRELLQLTTPSAVVALRAEMASGLAQFLDQQFVDPSVAAIASANPASITYGLSAIASSGTSAAAALVDIKALIASFCAANPDTRSAVLIMQPSAAVALAVASNSQTLRMSGGTLFGVEVITSQNTGSRIIMVAPEQVLLADENQVEFAASRQASIELSDSPSSPPTGSTVMVSLWQNGLTALRCERTMTWKLGRATACAFLSGVAYA